MVAEKFLKSQAIGHIVRIVPYGLVYDFFAIETLHSEKLFF